MRILVITNMYPPHHFGGYELSCEDAVRRFREAGHVVSVLTSDIAVEGQPTPADEEAQGIWRHLRIYWRDHALVTPPLRGRLQVERSNQAALERALAAAQPDVISVWNMGALSLGLLTTMQARRLPMVFVLADEWPTYAPYLDAWSRLFGGRGRRAIGRVVGRLTGLPTLLKDFSEQAACLFYSESMRQAAAERSSWTLPRTGVVYSGVDARDFPIAEEDDPIEPRPWRDDLLFVGRIDERKGTDTALQALAVLPDARLRVVGRGDEEHLAQLHRLAADLGVSDRVTFTVVERDHLRAEYASADVLLFTSRYEPFGIVPLEGMACDTPVIGTGAGGSGEYLVDEANCLRYPAGDADALAAAVRRLAANEQLRRRVVEGGRRTARALTTDSFASCLLAWHEAAQSNYADGDPGDRQPPVAATR